MEEVYEGDARLDYHFCGMDEQEACNREIIDELRYERD